jgi:hypothetical protein
MLLAYFGPETMLPLASIVATVVGVFLMLGRLSIQYALAPFRWIARARSPKQSMRGPTAWRRPEPSRRDAELAEPHAES